MLDLTGFVPGLGCHSALQSRTGPSRENKATAHIDGPCKVARPRKGGLLPGQATSATRFAIELSQPSPNPVPLRSRRAPQRIV